MDTTIAIYDNCENSMTPSRRSFLLRRELAKDTLAKRARDRALQAQAGLRYVLHWKDPRHVIELGNLDDDLRGLLNPDGSIHVWPMDQEAHRTRAVRCDLLDSRGNEGVHFYAYLSSTELGGSSLWGDDKREVTLVLEHLGVMSAIASAAPYEPPSYDDPFDDFDPYYLPHIHPLPPHPHPRAPHVEWIVTTYDGTFVATKQWQDVLVGGNRWWNFNEAWHQADNRNAYMMRHGLKTRYTVMPREEYKQNQDFKYR